MEVLEGRMFLWAMLVCAACVDVGAVTFADFYNVTNTQGTYWLSRGITTDFRTAQNYCSDINADLALFGTNKEFNDTVSSMSGFNFMTSYLLMATGVWIAMVSNDTNLDLYADHYWKREPISKTAWAPNEPSSSCVYAATVSECCAKVTINFLLVASRLNDTSCAEKNNFLCKPRNECSDGTAGCGHICTELTTGYFCSCIPGYRLAGDGRTCEDINECATTASTPKCDQTCANTIGSFTCGCFPGYRLSNDSTTCEDVDECVGPVCGQICTNVNGSYRCSCRQGFYLNYDGATCSDIDECAQESALCEHICQNKQGSFACECLEGYALGSDLASCHDIDECVSAPCQQVCSNVNGSYACSCNEGYELWVDGISCDASNATSDNATTSYPTSTTSNGVTGKTDALTESDFHVLTIAGATYLLSRSTNKNFTTAKTQCASVSASLAFFDTNAEYFNVTKYLDTFLATINGTGGNINGIWIDFNATDTDYNNIIEHAWKKEHFAATGIWATNEPSGVCRWSMYPGTCCARIVVDSSLKTASFRDATLSSNYSYLCKAINECSEGMARCNHSCTDKTIGYACSCRTGYELKSDNVTCVDVNECNHTTSPCQQTCNNTEGSYACGCFGGYVLDAGSSSCVDVNECNTTHHCQQNCNNVNGSYYCSCNTGYFLANDSKSCVDINECNNVINPPCHHTCNNVNGSYYCSCHSGFNLSADFRTCLDIDECYVTPNVCGQICNNTEGSYTCSCKKGYTLDKNNSSCSDVDECNTSPCNHSCNNTDGSFKCSCDVGYTLNADQRSCDDVNECMTSICQDNCTNTRGSYFCSCLTGYIIHNDGTSCLDIDECALNSSMCDGLCKNNLGGYTCECPNGYRLISSRCVDINECDEEVDNCSHICNNTDGSYVCSCHDDYILKNDSVTCAKMNTCKNGDFICQNNCTIPGKPMTCSCYPGFTIDIRDNASCLDIDECASNPCHQKCINMQGSYSCSCHNGFTLDDDLITCQKKQVYSSCPCSCLYSARVGFLKPQLVQQEIAEMRKKLRMVKTNLLAYRILKTSADDRRYAAQGVGYGGIVMVSLVLAVILATDILSCYWWVVGIMKTKLYGS